MSDDVLVIIFEIFTTNLIQNQVFGQKPRSTLVQIVFSRPSWGFRCEMLTSCARAFSDALNLHQTNS